MKTQANHSQTFRSTPLHSTPLSQSKISALLDRVEASDARAGGDARGCDLRHHRPSLRRPAAGSGADRARYDRGRAARYSALAEGRDGVGAAVSLGLAAVWK